MDVLTRQRGPLLDHCAPFQFMPSRDIVATSSDVQGPACLLCSKTGRQLWAGDGRISGYLPCRAVLPCGDGLLWAAGHAMDHDFSTGMLHMLSWA